MEPQKDILELKFEGSNINPSNIRPNEIAKLLISFEEALLSTIKKQNPEIDTNEVLFYFESIQNNSLDLQFTPKSAIPIVLSSYLLISKSIENSYFGNLDLKAIESLKTVVKFTKKYNCTAYFNHNGKTLSSVTGNTEIAIPNNKVISEETVIFGEITDAGGDNKSNVHIKINDEYIIICPTDRKTSKELGAKLYDKVKLAGTAKWDIETFRLLEFKLSEILEYTAGNTSKAISELKEKTSGYWDKFNTIEEINNELLRD